MNDIIILIIGLLVVQWVVFAAKVCFEMEDHLTKIRMLLWILIPLWMVVELIKFTVDKFLDSPWI